MAFGEDNPDPTGRNLYDPDNPLIELYNVEFHTGSPGDETPSPALPNLSYTDGTPISGGNYWLSFMWRLIDPLGEVDKGDYFDVVLDLGLSDIMAEVSEQVGTFAPIIYMANGTQAGTITWLNQSTYQDQQRIVIRIQLDAPDFDGLTGDGTDEGRVAGTGVWGFKYQAGDDATGDRTVYWEIGGVTGPTGGVPVTPEPPEGTVTPPGGNPNYNPYDEYESGYSKIGGRLTPDTTPVADTIFYWNTQINGHKHATLADWAACPNNTDNNPYNDDPAPPDQETFTIVDTGTNIAPTWLRDVTEVNGKPVIHPETPVAINRAGGLYGQTLGETGSSAYLKLFYVNTDYIWQQRIDYVGSPYRTPANDPNQLHQPSDGHPVGTYDPLYTTSYLKAGERDAMMYAPNYSGTGGAYAGYLTPVPPSDIRAIRMTQNGFEIDMVTAAVLGKTLDIAYMSRPATDSQGNYNNNVRNTVAIVGANDGNPVAGASGAVLIGGTISGNPLASPNKGKFVIDKYDYNTTTKMADVVFNAVATSEDADLQTQANALIDAQKAAATPPGSLRTDANGRLAIDLPPLPWAGGKPLTLTITETAPPDHFAVQPFTVVIEPENGTVISVTPGTDEDRFVQLAPDQYGVLVWDRSSTLDLSVYDAALLKWVKKVDREVNGQMVNVYYNDVVNNDVVSVKNGDIVLFRVDLYNHCHNPLSITQIEDDLPPGLVFDPTATIANISPDQPDYNNDLWEAVPGAAGEPDKIKYIGPPIQLPAWDGTMGSYPEWRLPLVLKVDVPDGTPDGSLLVNLAKITQIQNSDGEDVTRYDPTPENNYDDATVTPNNEIIVTCEVDKDTIRRTSVAYVSPPNREGFNNITDNETYRYDVNFRSTASMPADEFVVDDPLDNVTNGQVYLETLFTPVVWGDVDGKYNIWYKTNKTDDNTVYSNVKATGAGVAQKWPNKGYRLWAQNLSTTVRQRLDVSDLKARDGLADDEYITALRFEYGAVNVGFTSKNYSSVSLNGEHRDAAGDLTLPPADISMLTPLSSGTTNPTEIVNPNAVSTMSNGQNGSGGNFFTKLFSGLFGGGGQTDTASGAATTDANGQSAATSTDTAATDTGIQAASASTTAATTGATTAATTASTANTGITTAAATNTTSPTTPFTAIGPGDMVDWTPDPSRPDFALGALNATGLEPISYLVAATRPMTDTRIVASAASRIAKAQLWDEDIDAVITLELTTFMPSFDETGGLTKISTFADEVPKLDPNTEQVVKASGPAKTFDKMRPLLWVVMAFTAMCCALLLLRLYNMRKKRILLAQSGRRHAR